MSSVKSWLQDSPRIIRRNAWVPKRIGYLRASGLLPALISVSLSREDIRSEPWGCGGSVSCLAPGRSDVLCYTGGMSTVGNHKVAGFTNHLERGTRRLLSVQGRWEVGWSKQVRNCRESCGSSRTPGDGPSSVGERFSGHFIGRVSCAWSGAPTRARPARKPPF